MNHQVSEFGDRAVVPLPKQRATRFAVSRAVLLAEDNSINAELLAMMARKLGVSIEHAENGQEAVEMVSRAATIGRPYALVLMDVMMPVLDGVSATRALREAGHTADALPIIAITAAATSAEAKTYLAAGMQGCLAKPVNSAELAAAFDTWLPPSTLPAGKGGDPVWSSLWLRYEARKAETVKCLETAIAAQDFRPESVAELRTLLHKLAGTAGSFGEAGLSKAAMQCENALNEALPHHVSQTLVDCRDRLLRAA